ncbi:MAG: glycosyltransferase family 87 protein, partial [Fimbriiglobus sp.]
AVTLFLLIYPGYRSGLVLGQNPIVTLTILLGGWALLVRGKDTSGGMVWGLLAFKPVWGLAFVLAPLLMRRWRFCAAMAATGLGLVAATLPFTGWQVWLDWKNVGNEAAETYKVNKNWIELSRDLHGIPRRILLDFDAPEADRGHPWAGPLGWVLWGTVLLGTVGVTAWRGRRAEPTGLAAGFLFLGAFLCCYRFMYYDVLLSAVAVVVLWADPDRVFRFATWQYRWLPLGPRWVGYATAGPVLLVLMLLIGENVLHHVQPRATGEFQGWHLPATGAADPPTPRTPKLEFAVGFYHPWETVLVLGLWGWCGWRLAWAGHGADDV